MYNATFQLPMSYKSVANWPTSGIRLVWPEARIKPQTMSLATETVALGNSLRFTVDV